MPLKYNRIALALCLSSSMLLTACSDGEEGDQGAQGADGNNGLNSLLQQTPLAAGHSHCALGGVQLDSGLDANNNGMLDLAEISETSYVCQSTAEKNFNRVASFPVCQQIDLSCDTDTQTSAEIVAASTDGMTLIYTDSPQNRVGFVDITMPAAPKGLGVLALNGEPTSVAVKQQYALVAVNTSADYVNVSGELAVIDMASRTLVHTLDLGGQPDSIAISPDGRYAAIAIENERDEDLGEGIPPQLPAGYLVIVDLVGAPADWTTRVVNMTGLTAKFADDPEPEYVDINHDNIAVVTLQENNHIALVDLATGAVAHDFTAGLVNLTQIDTQEEKPALIRLSESVTDIPREPDGVSWLNDAVFATADEGDMDGGSRGFTLFNTQGNVLYSSGAELDHLAVRLGHYPDGRSGNKGNEPENIDFAQYGDESLLFVASERSSLVFVYDAADAAQPVLKQVLPAAVAPEGIKALPERQLFVAASEEDSRDDKMRAVINIYQYQQQPAAYPTIMSDNRADGTPMPWSALSGLAADPEDSATVYSVHDSFYQQSRIFRLNVAQQPARIQQEIVLHDSQGVLAGVAVQALADMSVDADDASRADVFDQADLAALINADQTVNLDLEGIAMAADGGFWLVSEGNGTVGEASRPVSSANLLLQVDEQGVIQQVVRLPAAVDALQLRFGFEGVAVDGDKVYVAFQRAWQGESNVRIGEYDTTTASWRFFFYPLDAVQSQNGGWVGLSELTALGNGRFMVIERDNQGGPDAAIKRLYQFSLQDVAADALISKTLLRDVMPDLAKSGGLIPEKIEGAAVLANGDVLIVNDNDGVDDNSGETQLLHLGVLQ